VGSMCPAEWPPATTRGAVTPAPVVVVAIVMDVPPAITVSTSLGRLNYVMGKSKYVFG
jgi:hypothetical protein